MASKVSSYIKLIPLDIFQVQRNRVLSGLLAIDIADSMGRQVHLALLLIWELVLPGKSIICQQAVIHKAEVAEHKTGWKHEQHNTPDSSKQGKNSPLIEPHIVLDKGESFAIKIGRPEGSSEIDVF